MSQLPLERTEVPGIYRRGSKYVVVYRVEGRQRKQYAGTLAEARAIKLERDGEARALRRGPTLHGSGSRRCAAVRGLAARPGRAGRLCDRSIANALTPLRLALDAAVAEGLLVANPAEQVVLPRWRAGRAWSTRERRYLTRAELVRLLDGVPAKWRPLFELLAATGLRISEAIGLRWSDLVR